MISTPFPALHIRRIHAGIYDWQLTLKERLLAHDDSLAWIEECLSHSLNNLPDEVNAIEIRYRGVGLGTYPTQTLRTAPDVIAASIVELFSAVMDRRT